MTKVFNTEPLAVGELFTMCVLNSHNDMILRVSAQIISKSCTHVDFINFGCPLAELTNQYQVFNNFLAQYLSGTYLRDIEDAANPALF